MCTDREIPEYFKLKVILAFGTVLVSAAPPLPCAFRWTVGDGHVGVSFWFRTAWVKMYLLVLLLIQFPSLTAITAAKHLEWILSSTSDERKCYQESPYQQQEESFNSFLPRTLAWNASFTGNIFSMLWRHIREEERNQTVSCFASFLKRDLHFVDFCDSVTLHTVFLQPAYVSSCDCWGTSHNHCLPTKFGLSSLRPALQLLLPWKFFCYFDAKLSHSMNRHCSATSYALTHPEEEPIVQQ